jgi:ABC-2 type transport system ATP-binding protein
MEEFDSRYVEVMVNPEHLAAARALKPVHERPVFGRSVLLFDRVDRDQLEVLGEVRRPSIADLFVAVMTKSAAQAQNAGARLTEENASVR